MPIFEFTSPEGKVYEVTGPNGSTKEQAFQILQQQLNAGGAGASRQADLTKLSDADLLALHSGDLTKLSDEGLTSISAPPQEGLASDIAKSAGGGMEAGFNRLMALPHDVAHLAHAVAPQRVIDAVKAIPGAQTVYSSLPDYEQVTAAADAARKNGRSPSIIGPDALVSDAYKDASYQPQTMPGRYARALTENAVPGLVTGMSPLAVGAGAVVGQAVEDATGSKTAGAIANLAGSIAAPLALARASRQAIQPLKDAAAVKAEANAGYASPALRGTTLTPQAVQGLTDDMATALADARTRFAPAQAPAVHSAIDNLASTNAPVSIEDLHSFRKTLGGIGKQTADFKPTEQAVAAGTAKRVLDRYLDNVPAGDVATGDPLLAVLGLRTANANWRAQANAGKVGNLIDNAAIANDGLGSGMNLGNKIRQSFKPLLNNDAARLRQMGYGDDVIDAVRSVNRGDAITNTLRHASNLLGGGGHIGSTVIGHGIMGAAGGAAGYEGGGLPGAVVGTLAGMAPGHLARVASNARTLKAAKAIQDSLLARAPANAGITAANRTARLANSAAYSAAVGSNGIPNILLQLFGLPATATN